VSCSQNGRGTALIRRLELYFSDKRNFLIVFKDKRERQRVVSKLTYKADQAGGVSKSIVGNFVLDQVARAIDRSEQQLEAITRKWQNREISNVSVLFRLKTVLTIVCIPDVVESACQPNAER